MSHQDRPLYEEDQVITDIDLHSIYNGFAWQLKQLKWYQIRYRIELKRAMHIIDTLHVWIHQGKPAVQTPSVQSNGGFQHEA